MIMTFINTLFFNPFNWYWQVLNANPDTMVWSSAASSYVSVEDATYQEWIAIGYAPTVIDTDVSLNDVLISNGLTPIFKSSTITALEFRNRFTPSEQMAVAALAISNAVVLDWYFHCAMAGAIDLSNTIVSNGIQGLAEFGVITTNRATEILTP